MDDSETTIDAALEQAAKLRPHYVHIVSQLFPVRLAGSGGITADRFLRLYYDPEAIGSWQLDWAASRVLVQVEHYYRRHAARQLGREQVTWDVAAEIAITSTLSREGLRFPANTLYPETFKLPDGLTAEQYAERLFRMCMSRRRKLGEQLAELAGQDLPVFGSAGSAELRDWELPEDADVPTIDYLVAVMLQREAESEESVPGKGAGSEPRSVDETRVSAVDWRIELRGVVGSIISTRPGMADYSFAVPDPDVAFHGDLLMPGMVGLRANAGVVIDSSGSMGERRLAQALAETGSILRNLEGDGGGVFVYSCDAAVHTAKEVFHQQQVSLIGGGGTDMGAGIRAAASRNPRPDVIIVITDGDTPWPRKGPKGIRVIVVLVGNGSSPKWAYKTIRVPMG